MYSAIPRPLHPFRRPQTCRVSPLSDLERRLDHRNARLQTNYDRLNLECDSIKATYALSTDQETRDRLEYHAQLIVAKLDRIVQMIEQTNADRELLGLLRIELLID